MLDIVLAAALVSTPVEPVRIVAASETLSNASFLVEKKFAQVPEGPFIAGGGPVLAKGDWLILDFGRELHGSLQIGAGGRGGRGAKARIRLGESVAET
ncbi:MAG: hypothetical protein ILO34_07870, partial [Kiritimatiellae bacterium]|nr:hypothetical protein [Kiritimatiellia bacterium]